MEYNISVIIPSFNRAHCLSKALDSIVDQSLTPAEIIVIDDGSTDDTREFIRNNYPSVVYLFQNNCGVSSARNLGVNISKGNWIAFLDSDDEWLPDKLAHQVQALRDNPDYHLCHTNEIWIRNGRRVNPLNKHEKVGGEIFERCLPLCAISPSSVLLRKALLDEIGGFDEALPACEDYDLWLRICASYPVIYLEQPLLKKYGGHRDQLSHRFWGLDRFRVVSLEKIIASGKLDQKQSNAATTMLLNKCRILANGALKRGKLDRESFYREKINSYET